MKNDPTHILLIEDNLLDARLMTEMLEDASAGGYAIQHVDRISAALHDLVEQKFDVILLDLHLPDGRGLDTVGRICSACPQVPVIVLTGLEDDALSLAAVQAGAQDYLVKGQVEGHEITRAIRYAIERKRLEERLQFQATHDALTGLPNRRLFQDRMDHAVDRSRRNATARSDKCGLAVMLLDLDNFKSVNDTLGHPRGDLLLQAVADRLQAIIRKSDTLARMGGDEFTLICEGVEGRADAEILARRIMAVFSSPFQVGDRPIVMTSSIGISLYPNDAEDAETLLKQADIAMYRAKSRRNSFWLYEMCKEDL
jgi:diguanylate cyclase (GGDEF)-like protein